MARYVIEGGGRIAGDVELSGNKNEALPALVACLLTDQPVTLQRVPRIHDVLTICDLLISMGVRVRWEQDPDTHHPSTVHVHAETVDPGRISAEKCEKVRAAILFLGPLLARCQAVTLPLPGGDVIGARRIDTHFEGLSALGAKMEFGSWISAQLQHQRAQGAEIFLDEPSVTATENVLLLATLADGRTTIQNAACEPHVTGLCRMLVSMGAKISGIGSNHLTIDGVSHLHSACHRIDCDFMEMASYISLGATCGGTLTLHGVQVHNYPGILRTWKKIGLCPEVAEDSITIHGDRELVMQSDVSGRVGTVYSAPWPGFPTDLMSVAIVAATQATGTMIFFEKMFEGRMFFTDKLEKMGANIVLCDPHRIVVTGPSPLSACRMSSPDVRAGMALIIAACIAQGVSTIDHIYQVERGYERVIEKLSAIGAKITASSR